MTQHVKTCGTERFRLMPVLRYTTSAENDRLDAWLFIAEDPQHAADCLLDTIHHEAMQLLAHPEKGVRRPELANGIREWPTSTQRLLFHYPDDEGIIVARMVHHDRLTAETPELESPVVLLQLVARCTS